MDEVIPLADLRVDLDRRLRLLASEPATYLAREADREDLVLEEEEATRSGVLRPAGRWLAYERSSGA